MAEQKPRTLEAVLAKARALFLSDRSLTVWEAAERVLDGLTDDELTLMYKRYSYAWCRDALRRGTLLASGVEALGMSMRKDPALRRQDDARALGPVQQPRPRRSRRRSR